MLYRELRSVARAASTAYFINRMAARAGARTLFHRMRCGPRQTGWSLPFESVVEMMTLGTPDHDIRSASQIREPLDRMTFLARRQAIRQVYVPLGDFAGEWLLTPCSRPERTLLYLHGGGYVSGSPRSHRALIGYLAQAAQARVFVPDYRLAPEHPFPAAVIDAWSAYWWLLCQGIPPTEIVVAGDSAGAGLTVALCLALRDAGLPLPAGCVCLSPWFDLALTGASLSANARTDYLNFEILRASAAMYLNGHDAHEPLASPLYADLQGLPPLLVHVGTAEMLLDDSIRFAEHARAAGVTVELKLWPGMVHVWHFTYLLEPKARQAVEQIGAFVAAIVAKPPVRELASA